MVNIMDNYELYTALVTPVLANGEINYQELKKIIDNQIVNNVNGIVIGGTTGLGCLYQEKIFEVTSWVTKMYFGKIKIIVGIANNNFLVISEMITKLNKLKIDGYLVLTPHYLIVSQDDLYQYYKKITSICEHSVIIYHVPTRTSQTFLTETMIKCLSLPKIKGIKLASFDLNMIDMIKEQTINKKIYLGSDINIDQLENGFDGIISVFSNLNPKVMKKSFNNILIRNRLIDFFKKFNELPNPVGIISLMNELGYDIGNLPFPFSNVQNITSKTLVGNYKLLLEGQNDVITIIGKGRMGNALANSLSEYNLNLLDIRDMDETNIEKLINSKIIIDFSHPNSLNEYMNLDYQNNPIFIIGTTGYSSIENIKILGKKYPVLYDSNYSIGMTIMCYALSKIKNLKIAKNYVSSIVEVHHNKKIDKPSGTAIKIKNIIGSDSSITSKRIGDINGIHVVNFDDKFDSLKIIHKLKEREAIVKGVLLGMKLMLKKPIGLYNFEELIINE